MLLAAGGLGIGATATTVNDDVKHAFAAAQRSGRVVRTLFVNINECVGLLND